MKSDMHIPVLLNDVLAHLDPKSGESYLDLTAGYAGHAQSVLQYTANPRGAVLVDRDENAICVLGKQFAGSAVQIIHDDFLSAAGQLKAEGRQFDTILADLGVSSPHLNTASRGFSIRSDGPLDMRMDERQSVTAAAVVNSYDEAALSGIIRRYGEEPRAKRIARSIVEHRPVQSTAELAHIVAQAIGRQGKIHPATRTFQAIRIAVNNELELLEAALPIWIDLLAPGGRIVVISFHSLEDRLVKQAFAERSKAGYEATLRLLTKRPVTGNNDELVFNPRARSAKLRAAVKIKNQK
jgi:16S rRNA (cytosine1402-N4)-methyltransferase